MNFDPVLQAYTDESLLLASQPKDVRQIHIAVRGPEEVELTILTADRHHETEKMRPEALANRLNSLGILGRIRESARRL